MSDATLSLPFIAPEQFFRIPITPIINQISERLYMSRSSGHTTSGTHSSENRPKDSQAQDDSS